MLTAHCETVCLVAQQSFGVTSSWSWIASAVATLTDEAVRELIAPLPTRVRVLRRDISKLCSEVNTGAVGTLPRVHRKSF